MAKYYRFDKSPLWELHSSYFKEVGIKAWQRGDIPYSGVSNYHEAFKKALLFIENIKKYRVADSSSYIKVLEIGSGYGEFAKNFFQAFEDICKEKNLDYYKDLKYYLTDFSESVLKELQNSGRLDEYREKIVFLKYDVLEDLDKVDLETETFDLVLANYLLDQLPARIFSKKILDSSYYEKFLSVDLDDEKFQRIKKKQRGIKWLNKKTKFKNIDIWQNVPVDELEILQSCFKINKDSTVVYSYGALGALKNFMKLIHKNALIICSDFNASAKPGFDKYEPCYYGNSIAQAVNFEFLFKYFKNSAKVLIYEDPIKPLHTFVLTKPDYEFSLELGEIYEKIYSSNVFLRLIYKFLVQLKLSFYIFFLVLLLLLFYDLFLDGLK